MSPDDRRTPPPGVGARLVADVLEDGLLPAYVPGDPGPLGATLAAHQAAPAFVQRLARVYGVTEWTPTELKRAFLDGAMREWHGQAKVGSVPSALRMASPTCPVADDVAQDPRLCIMCQAFQIAVAREALGERVADAGFASTIHDGASDCVATVTLRPETPG